uniref:Uncharacterized protein n=1 Tax=Molossus molossus TaxID=27622 RepID=A0A7J8JWX2_MOLMO|nr:hypothetical protein HJG59_007904 [Molossus molossus]
MRGLDRAGGLIFHAPIERRRNGDEYQLSGSLDFTPIARSCEGAYFGEPKVLLAYKAVNSPSQRCTEKLLLRDQRGQAYVPNSLPPYVNWGVSAKSWANAPGIRCTITCPWLVGLRPRKLTLPAEFLDIMRLSLQFESLPPFRTLLSKRIEVDTQLASFSEVVLAAKK